MSASRVLVIEDSEAIRLPVTTALSALGYEVEGWPDGSGLSQRLGQSAPDLVILDVMLPGRNGFELLEEIRRTSTAAVIMLTARDTTADRVHGLTGGADDYVVKPFAMVELAARVQAVLRRVGAGGGATAVGDLVISQDLSVITRDGRELELTDTERRLLGYLAAHRDRVVSKTQILTAVWGYGGFDDNLVEVNISALRRKIESEGGARLLHTVRGRGYVLGAER